VRSLKRLSNQGYRFTILPTKGRLHENFPLAVTTLTFATPASAQFNNNGGGQLLGALIGGTAGAAIGDGIAPRGRSTEFGIAGGLIGGVAGAAIAGETTPAAINIAVGLTMAADITTGARPIISSLASSIANPYIASLFIAVPSIRPLIIMAGLVSVIQGSAAPR